MATGAAPPLRVATVSVRARPVDAADQSALEPDEVARLVKRGEDSLAQGDIAAARLILGRAAEAHDARAALSLGASFDPAVLRQLHVLGFRPDLARARAWYEMAAQYGSAEASSRLAGLPRLEQ
jgi:TPR repeat protein